MAPESDPEAAAGWGAAGQRQPRAPLLGPQPRPAFVIRVGPSCLRWAVPGAGSEDSGEEAAVPASGPAAEGIAGAVGALRACELGRSGRGSATCRRPLPGRARSCAHAPSSRKPVQVSLSF